MSNQQGGYRVSTNLFWRFAERCGAQGIQFIVSIILARLLDPSMYGTISIVTVFTTILTVFVDSGFGNALVQKKGTDDLDYSTVFFFNIGMCSVLYGMVFIAAPFIADFYETPELTDITRVLSLMIIVSGVKNVQQAYISKTMQFKRFFFATIGGTIVSAVVGIWMAYNGYGVWALVWQTLINCFIDTFILWITVKWKPKFMFSFQRLKGLFNYGWKLLVSALLDTGYRDVRQLIIGKLYSASDLAFYNKGNQMPSLIITNINSSINSVLFPVMSNVQEDAEQVKAITRRSIRTSSYLMWPIMLGLAACCEPLISFMMTDKWLPCVPFMRLFCISYAFYPIHSANLSALKALGRSDLFLKLEVIKKVIGIILIVGSMWFGVMAMAYSLVISAVLSSIINAAPNKKLLKYGYFDQLKDIYPPFVLSLIMAVIVYCVEFFGLSNILTLLIQVPLGAAIYIGGSALLKLDSFYYILDMLKQIIKSRTAKSKTINQKK